MEAHFAFWNLNVFPLNSEIHYHVSLMLCQPHKVSQHIRLLATQMLFGFNRKSGNQLNRRCLFSTFPILGRNIENHSNNDCREWNLENSSSSIRPPFFQWRTIVMFSKVAFLGQKLFCLFCLFCLKSSVNVRHYVDMDAHASLKMDVAVLVNREHVRVF